MILFLDSGDGLLFAGRAALGGRGDARLDATVTWKMTIEEFDRNHDNQIQRDEMTAGFAFMQRRELPQDNPGYELPARDMDDLLKIFATPAIARNTLYLRTTNHLYALSE